MATTVPLLGVDTGLPIEGLKALRDGALEELAEALPSLTDAPGAGPERAARGLTVRTLVADTLAWARRRPVPTERAALVEEINLLHDIGVVVGEYYKLFVREPTPGRPAGRI
jgi:hypothetical protein